jgi:hypothetical protein
VAGVSARTAANLDGQGFGALDAEAKAQYALSLRFTPAVGTLLVVVGLFAQSPVVLATMALIAVSGALLPNGMILDVAYNVGVRHLFGTPPLPPTPRPRRFSYALSAACLAGASASFAYDLPVLGFVLGGVVAAGGTVLALTLWCLGSWLYRIVVPSA